MVRRKRGEKFGEKYLNYQRSVLRYYMDSEENARVSKA